MKPIKYLLFVLCFASTFAVSARSPVEQDVIKIKIIGQHSAFFSAKGRNLRVETNLEYFHCNECSFKNLQHLDMSHKPELTYLRLFLTTFTSLDISQNIKLDTFLCEYTKIESLDLSNNRMLSYISLDRNNFSPQELKSVFYSLHDNQIPGKKKSTSIKIF